MNVASISKKLDEISTQLNALEKGQMALKRSMGRLQPPSTAASTVSVVDGPVPPDGFRFNGKTYGPFTRLEWRLLQCLGGKDALEISEVLEAMYGHDHVQDQDALRSVIKRLNPKFRKQSFPGRVSFRHGYVALQLWPKAKGVRNGSGPTIR